MESGGGGSYYAPTVTKGIRSVVDVKGNFVTSKAAEAEEEEINFEGMFAENASQFETMATEASSQNELTGDDLEKSMDAFMLKYFAEEK